MAQQTECPLHTNAPNIQTGNADKLVSYGVTAGQVCMNIQNQVYSYMREGNSGFFLTGLAVAGT